MAERKLTAQQLRFVEEYLVDLNAAQAAIRAGYSPRTAYTVGPRLLRDPRIATAVAAAQAARSARTGITADEVLLELRRLALVDIGEAFDAAGQLKALKDMPADVRRCIAALEVELTPSDNAGSLVQQLARDRLGRAEDGAERPPAMSKIIKLKFWDKVRGLELLGKHLKLFTEKHEHSGKDGAPLGVVILPAERD